MNLPCATHAEATALLRGLPPIVGEGARVLVLGSMPGAESIRRREYYGHPRNHFWRIIEDVFNVPRGLPYSDRTAALRENGVAVWDVLATCARQGSLDAAIDRSSIRVNDIAALVASQPLLARVLFNGAFTETIYRRQIKARVDGVRPLVELRMPSTSPANAMCAYEQKLAAWGPALAP